MKNVRRRRGLSTVVTAAIMLTFIAVLGTALVSWSNSNLRGFETSLANSTSTLTNQVNENLSVENLLFCNQVNALQLPGTPGINVTITNIGTQGFKVTKILVNGTDSSNSAFVSQPQNTLLTNPLSLLPAQSGTIMIPKIWDHKSQSTITIVTSRGSTINTQGVAP